MKRREPEAKNRNRASSSPELGESESDDSDSDSSSEEGGSGSPAFSDYHRRILQGFMDARYLGTSGVRTLFRRAQLAEGKEPTDDPAQYVEIIRQINSKIARFNMQIIKVTSEMSGQKAYMFNITAESPLMKHQGLFSKQEMELFKQSLELLLGKGADFTASFSDCLNLCLKVPGKFSLDQANAFINKMLDTQNQYYAKVFKREDDEEDFHITLGIRSIRELEILLRESYPNALILCGLCKTYMLHGFRCPGRKCDFFVHKYCYKDYVKTAQECTKCKAPWLNQADMIDRKTIAGNATEDVESDANSEAETVVSVGNEVDESEMDTQLTPSSVSYSPVDMDTAENGHEKSTSDEHESDEPDSSD